MLLTHRIVWLALVLGGTNAPILPTSIGDGALDAVNQELTTAQDGRIGQAAQNSNRQTLVNSQVNAIATQTRDWQTPWNDYFLPLITYRWGDYEFLQLPRLFSHQPAGEDLLATVQDWTSSLVRYHVSFKQLRPDVLEDLQSWMFDYFHREHRTSRVFTLISQRENGRNYLVTHHKNSRWTKNAHRATFIAVWSARNTEMGVQLVLHGLVSSGWDWTRFGHPLFLAYERVPEVNGLFKIYAPALPDTSSSLTPSNSPALPFYSV